MSAVNPITNLKDYFITKAANMQRDFDVSNSTGHPGDTGENRQNLLIDFLNEHLPARYEALIGGKIFDSAGAISEQVDVIVYDKNTPRLKDQARTLFMVEGVACAIEVKPDLDPASLKEGLDKVDSFKLASKAIIAPISSGDIKKRFTQECSRLRQKLTQRIFWKLLLRDIRIRSWNTASILYVLTINIFL